MSDLILLCAGALPDLDQSEAGFGERLASALADDLREGRFQQMFRAGRVLAKSADEEALPRELPDEAWLRQRFGIPAGDAVQAWHAPALDVPLPAWQVAPCNVQVGHYQLVLTDPTDLALTQEDAEALGDSVRELFAASGFELAVASPSRWYLLGNADWELDTHAWTMAVGRSIDGYLPAGPCARAWRRLFTECQIAWHEHPVNLARESRGLRPANALWLDGCARGPLPAADAGLAGDSLLLQGLAGGSGAKHHAVAWQALDPATVPGIASTSDLIVDVDAWRAARRQGDAWAWREAWLAFDRWLGERGLDTGRCGRFDRICVVMTGERRRLELEVKRRMRWWPIRRFDALAALMDP